MALATVSLALLASGGADAAAAIGYALDLAGRDRARLIAAAPLSVPALAYTGYTAASQMLMFIERENAARKQDAEAKALFMRAEAERLGLNADIEVVCATYEAPTPLLLRRARVSDVCIVSAPPQGEPAQRDLVVDMLFGAGVPLLAVPSGWRAGPVAKAIVAWDGRRAAARAVHDALPLLRGAQSIEIVCVQGDGEAQSESAAALAPHLAGYCRSVGVTVLPRQGGVAAALCAHARARGADLMIMGAYGHSRLREFVLGGATRDMLAQIAIPTLMSH